MTPMALPSQCWLLWKYNISVHCDGRSSAELLMQSSWGLLLQVTATGKTADLWAQWHPSPLPSACHPHHRQASSVLPVPPGVRWVTPTQHSHTQTHPSMEHLEKYHYEPWSFPGSPPSLHAAKQYLLMSQNSQRSFKALMPSVAMGWAAWSHPITSTRCSSEEGGIPALGPAPLCQDSTDLCNHTRSSGYFISAVMRLCKPLKAKCFLLL